MNAVEMKFERVPHGLEILRQAAGVENCMRPSGFVKATIRRKGNCYAKNSAIYSYVKLLRHPPVKKTPVIPTVSCQYTGERTV